MLDGVEDGEVNWKTVVSNFYPDLEQAVKTAEAELAKIKVEDEVTDILCEECGRNMVVKYGPHGKFLACPAFPECRNTKPYLVYVLAKTVERTLSNLWKSIIRKRTKISLYG